MKKTIITLLAIVMVSYGFAQEVAVSKTSPTASASANFQWANTTYDFGKTKVGIPVSYEFSFRNSGMLPLVISSVKASCGCTVAAYTKEPVAHGASGFVRATYNAASTGVYSKTVTVSANTPEGVIHLTVRGEIVE